MNMHVPQPGDDEPRIAMLMANTKMQAEAAERGPVEAILLR